MPEAKIVTDDIFRCLYENIKDEDTKVEIRKVTKTVFVTTDGSEFEIRDKALEHEHEYQMKLSIEAMIRESTQTSSVLDWGAVEMAEWIAKNYKAIEKISDDLIRESRI